MKPLAFRFLPPRLPARQRGISLFVVMVVVLLSTLLAMWAFRSALLNQMMVRNEASYSRVFEAAQALMQDAELDIMGKTSNGQLCQRDTSKPDICRKYGGDVLFPEERAHFTSLMRALNASATKCKFGICQKRTGAQDFWNAPKATLDAMLGDGARYGQYTGAASTGNPLLSITDAGKGGWYWVEVMQYNTQNNTHLMSGGSGTPNTNSVRYAPQRNEPFVYRITVLVRGNGEGEPVVLQSVVSRTHRL